MCRGREGPGRADDEGGGQTTRGALPWRGGHRASGAHVPKECVCVCARERVGRKRTVQSAGVQSGRTGAGGVSHSLGARPTAHTLRAMDEATRPLRDALVQTLSTNPVRASVWRRAGVLAPPFSLRSRAQSFIAQEHACFFPSDGFLSQLTRAPPTPPHPPTQQAVIKQAEAALQQAAQQSGYAFALLKVKKGSAAASLTPRAHTHWLPTALPANVLSLNAPPPPNTTTTIRSSPRTRPSSCARPRPSTSKTTSSSIGRQRKTRTARRRRPSQTLRRPRCAA